VWVVAAVLLVLAGTRASRCFAADPAKPGAAPADPRFTPILKDTFHNAHRVTDKLLSGDQPVGDAAFKALADAGVKTIISVDGAAPDVEAAKKYGVRYVHLPIGYDSVPAERGREIAKALAELPGKIYLHCHHGKHRSASAVAVACVYNGSLKPEDAEPVLKTFGTGANYKGLWQSARDARPLEPSVLEKLEVKYVERAKIPELAEAMVKVDQHWDHIVALQKNGWQVLKDHPDLDPPHEALQVQEHLHEIGRMPDQKERPEDFHRMLKENEARVVVLRGLLAAKPVNREAADAAFKLAAASCKECHVEYRD